MERDEPDEDDPLPNTLLLERVQALLVEARDELRLVCAREYTREFNVACQRKRRAANRKGGSPATEEPHRKRAAAR